MPCGLPGARLRGGRRAVVPGCGAAGGLSATRGPHPSGDTPTANAETKAGLRSRWGRGARAERIFGAAPAAEEGRRRGSRPMPTTWRSSRPIGPRAGAIELWPTKRRRKARARSLRRRVQLAQICLGRAGRTGGAILQDLSGEIERRNLELGNRRICSPSLPVAAVPGQAGRQCGGAQKLYAASAVWIPTGALDQK